MDWVDLARRYVPPRWRYFLQRFVSLTDFKLRYRAQNSPYAQVSGSDKNTCGSPYRIGVLSCVAQYHCNYVAACIEMGVPFRVIDIAGPDWMKGIRESRCDVFLVWPDGPLSTWNTMVKDRVEIMERDLGLAVFPSFNDIWMYEDKRRTAYWLQAHELPHPKTWVFYELSECLDFIASCNYPIVFKANFGAAASGVKIFKDRRKLEKFVRRVFRSGFVPNGFDKRDPQRGSVLLQEYIPDIKEWRLVRIGDSFFGHVKGRVGNFHSGSGRVEWDVPDERHLDFLDNITRVGRFYSMGVDVFETPEGHLLINELQALFGASSSVHQLKINGEPGRFIKASDEKWFFESGDFARNMCANERVKYVIGSRYKELVPCQGSQL